MAMEPRVHRFTADEFEGMAGVPGLEEARMELIEGEIVDMAPIGSRHHGCVTRLGTTFMQALGARAVVSVQGPVRLGDFTEPQPDVMLLRPRDDFYSDAHPLPGDVLLLVEVADTTLAHDTGRKLPLYMAAGIPEVWIVDLAGHRVEVHRPGAETAEFQRGDRLSPAAFPEVDIEVADLVG